MLREILLESNRLEQVEGGAHVMNTKSPLSPTSRRWSPPVRLPCAPEGKAEHRTHHSNTGCEVGASRVEGEVQKVRRVASGWISLRRVGLNRCT